MGRLLIHPRGYGESDLTCTFLKTRDSIEQGAVGGYSALQKNVADKTKFPREQKLCIDVMYALLETQETRKAEK